MPDPQPQPQPRNQTLRIKARAAVDALVRAPLRGPNARAVSAAAAQFAALELPIATVSTTLNTAATAVDGLARDANQWPPVDPSADALLATLQRAVAAFE